MLKALLARRGASRSDFRDARRVLTFPWCRPPEGHPLHATALEVCPTGGRAPEPGEVLLVGVTAPERGEAALLASGSGRLPFGKEARTALDVAISVLQKFFAGWRIPADNLGSLEPVAKLVAPGALAGQLDEIDGASFGVALLLAEASLALGVAVPADVVALARLDADGTLKAVEALPAKLRAAQGWAPAVRRCVVAKAQASEAQEMGFEVLACGNAHEVLDAVLPAPRGTPEAEAHRLLTLVLQPSRPVLNWPEVERLANTLAHDAAIASQARRKARIVAAIAARHNGRPGPAPELHADALDDVPRPVRDRLAAHRLQHLADSGEDDGGEVDAMSRRLPRPVDASLTELETLGALGRALARRRDYLKAEALLGDVTRQWLAIGDVRQANHPLCEWTRVVGILEGVERRPEYQGRVRGIVVPLARRVALEFRLGPAGQGTADYLVLAVARACIQAGALDEAEAWWTTSDFSYAQPWVRTAVERWKARLLWARGRRGEALEALRQVHGGPAEMDMVALAHLDAAFLGRDGVAAALDAFLTTDGRRECAWLLAGADSVEERARRLVHESPY
jgi:hypothetical protein